MTRPPTFQTVKTLVRYLAAIFMAALLAGCYMNTESISQASVTQWQGGKLQGKAKPLLSAATAQFDAWLTDHRWGWLPVHGTFLPALTVSLTHTDGTVTTANLRKGSLIIGDYQLSLADAEYECLRDILSPPENR